jgi:hypothetical protein
MTIYAHVEVADEVLVSMSGKLTIAGFYTGDIAIPTAPLYVPQLVFIFFIRGEAEDVVHSLRMKLTLPGETERIMPIPLAPEGTVVPPGRSRWFIRTPFLIQNISLNPGEVKTAVLIEDNEVDSGSLWVSSPVTISQQIPKDAQGNEA